MRKISSLEITSVNSVNSPFKLGNRLFTENSQIKAVEKILRNLFLKVHDS